MTITGHIIKDLLVSRLLLFLFGIMSVFRLLVGTYLNMFHCFDIYNYKRLYDIYFITPSTAKYKNSFDAIHLHRKISVHRCT